MKASLWNARPRQAPGLRIGSPGIKILGVLISSGLRETRSQERKCFAEIDVNAVRSERPMIRLVECKPRQRSPLCSVKARFRCTPT
jgi:hypothetical protein